VHRDGSGNPDIIASRRAAEEMVAGFGIVFRPALTSRHTEGNAIDMMISWNGNLTIVNRLDRPVTITSVPRDGGNLNLHQVGAAYGVFKLVSDPPHWSSDGR
jgi:hypothetical protein